MPQKIETYKRVNHDVSDNISFINKDKYIRSEQIERNLINKEGGNSQKKVINDDERRKIINSSVYPFSTIVKLVMRFSGKKKFYGTGTIISNYHLLTAAHNIYNHDLGGWATEIGIYPARAGRILPFGYTKMTQTYIQESYIKNHSEDYDFGLIKFLRPYANITGTSSIISYKNPIDNFNIRIIGYPLDKKLGAFMFYSKDITKYRKNLLYTADTYRGQSGSGIFQPTGSYLLLAGIHLGYNKKHKLNRGISLNYNIINFIDLIINKKLET